MAEPMDALLLFPPSLEAYGMPEIALSRLQAWLRAHGYRVRQVDLNAEYWSRYLFEDDACSEFLDRLALLARGCSNEVLYRSVREVLRLTAAKRPLPEIKSAVWNNRREVFLFVFERTRFWRLNRDTLERALGAPDPLLGAFLDRRLGQMAEETTPRVVGSQ
jgi:hypothetical protein